MELKNVQSLSDKEIGEATLAKIRGDMFACVGGKAVVGQNRYRMNVYSDVKNEKDIEKLYKDLCEFADEVPVDSDNYLASYIAVFKDIHVNDEDEFNGLLWELLQSLNEIDTVPWNKDVSSDICDTNFSYSLGGTAFFVIGMHPKASRISRRFPYVTIVFNKRESFNILRQKGLFEKFQEATRKNDIRIQGTINKNLANFGDSSEALQYSGMENPSFEKIKFKAKEVK